MQMECVVCMCAEWVHWHWALRCVAGNVRSSETVCWMCSAGTFSAASGKTETASAMWRWHMPTGCRHREMAVASEHKWFIE